MNTFEIIAYPLLPIAAMELLLGFLLLTQHRRSSPVHRAAAAIAFFSAAYALNTAVMYLTASRGHDFTLFARLNWIGWFAVPAGLQFIFYLGSETSRTARAAAYSVYAYWGLIMVFCLFTDLIVTPRYSLIPYASEPGPIEIPVRVTGALMTVWLNVAIMRTRRRLKGIKKFQLDHFFYGMLIFSFAGVAVAGIMPAINEIAVEPGLGSYFSLPWVVLTFYAIVRYSLFEMRIILSQTLAVIILVLACSAVQFAVTAAVAPALGTGLSTVVSLSLIGFFLFGTPFSRKIQSLADRLIIGDRYNYEALMREAIVTLNTKQEMPELIDYLIGTVRSGLGVKDAGIYLYRVEDGFVLREGNGLFLAMKNQGSLADIALKKLQETNRSLVLAEMAGAEEDQDTFRLTTYLGGIEAEALVPLLFQGRLQGALVLGKKASGEMFGQSDIRFLETLAAHAASALENARLNEIASAIRSSLKESEERFMTLARRMPAAVFICRGGRIVYANNASEEMTGYSCSRLTTMSFSDLLCQIPLVRDRQDSPGSEEPHVHSGNEVRVLHANSAHRWAVMTSAVIEYGEQAGVISILFDITDHKRAEGKIRRERMREAVGRMASYLSTELELLAKDLRLTAALQEYGEEGHGCTESSRRAMAAAEQAEFLVRTVKEFSMRRKSNRSIQEISGLIAKRQQILAAMLTGKCEFVMRPSSESLTVKADPIRLESALMNLVLSARDRMQRGGVITVSTGRALIDADFIRRSGYGRMGMYASVSITDTGECMTAAEQDRIFEPFYTARGGNCMDLSIVYDIVKEHEGYITVTSRPGEGNSCIIYLPLEQGLSPS